MISRLKQPGGLLILSLLGLVVLTFLYTMTSPQKAETTPLPNRSLYNAAPMGVRAWYLTLKKAGLPIKSWERAFKELSDIPHPSTMVIVEPYTVAQSSIIFGQKDIDALFQWVQRGNTLVFLDNWGRYGAQYILKRMNVADLGVVVETYTIPASMQMPQTLSVPTTQADDSAQKLLQAFMKKPILTESRRRFRVDSVDSTRAASVHVLLQDSAHRPVLIALQYGQGKIILGTAPDLAANHYLRQPANDNYQFLTNLLTLERKPILLNEFVHGYTEITDLLSYYQQKTPLGDMLVQLGIGFLFLLWLSFVRWTPKALSTQELSALEQTAQLSADGVQPFIQSLASIYERSHAASLAIGPQVQQIEQTLQKRFGLGLKETGRLQHLLASLSDAYSGKEAFSKPVKDDWFDILQKAQRVIREEERLSHRDVLQLSRQLTMIQEHLHHGQPATPLASR